MQTPSASSNVPASTQPVSNKGLNIPKQDVPNTSSEPSNILPLITKLSP
jgi:hypothetical protein